MVVIGGSAAGLTAARIAQEQQQQAAQRDAAAKASQQAVAVQQAAAAQQAANISRSAISTEGNELKEWSATRPIGRVPAFYTDRGAELHEAPNATVKPSSDVPKTRITPSGSILDYIIPRAQAESAGTAGGYIPDSNNTRALAAYTGTTAINPNDAKEKVNYNGVTYYRTPTGDWMSFAQVPTNKGGGSAPVGIIDKSLISTLNNIYGGSSATPRPTNSPWSPVGNNNPSIKPKPQSVNTTVNNILNTDMTDSQEHKAIVKSANQSRVNAGDILNVDYDSGLLKFIGHNPSGGAQLEEIVGPNTVYRIGITGESNVGAYPDRYIPVTTPSGRVVPGQYYDLKTGTVIINNPYAGYTKTQLINMYGPRSGAVEYNEANPVGTMGTLGVGGDIGGQMVPKTYFSSTDIALSNQLLMAKQAMNMVDQIPSITKAVDDIRIGSGVHVSGDPNAQGNITSIPKGVKLIAGQQTGRPIGSDSMIDGVLNTARKYLYTAPEGAKPWDMDKTTIGGHDYTIPDVFLTTYRAGNTLSNSLQQYAVPGVEDFLFTTRYSRNGVKYTSRAASPLDDVISGTLEVGAGIPGGIATLIGGGGAMGSMIVQSPRAAVGSAKLIGSAYLANTEQAFEDNPIKTGTIIGLNTLMLGDMGIRGIKFAKGEIPNIRAGVHDAVTNPALTESAGKTILRGVGKIDQRLPLKNPLEPGASIDGDTIRVIKPQAKSGEFGMIRDAQAERDLIGYNEDLVSAPKKTTMMIYDQNAALERISQISDLVNPEKSTMSGSFERIAERIPSRSAMEPGASPEGDVITPKTTPKTGGRNIAKMLDETVPSRSPMESGANIEGDTIIGKQVTGEKLFRMPPRNGSAHITYVDDAAVEGMVGAMADLAPEPDGIAMRFIDKSASKNLVVEKSDIIGAKKPVGKWLNDALESRKPTDKSASPESDMLRSAINQQKNPDISVEIMGKTPQEATAELFKWRSTADILHTERTDVGKNVAMFDALDMGNPDLDPRGVSEEGRSTTEPVAKPTGKTIAGVKDTYGKNKSLSSFENIERFNGKSFRSGYPVEELIERITKEGPRRVSPSRSVFSEQESDASHMFKTDLIEASALGRMLKMPANGGSETGTYAKIKPYTGVAGATPNTVIRQHNDFVNSMLNGTSNRSASRQGTSQKNSSKQDVFTRYDSMDDLINGTEQSQYNGQKQGDKQRQKTEYAIMRNPAADYAYTASAKDRTPLLLRNTDEKRVHRRTITRVQGTLTRRANKTEKWIDKFI